MLDVQPQEIGFLTNSLPSVRTASKALNLEMNLEKAFRATMAAISYACAEPYTPPLINGRVKGTRETERLKAVSAFLVAMTLPKEEASIYRLYKFYTCDGEDGLLKLVEQGRSLIESGEHGSVRDAFLRTAEPLSIVQINKLLNPATAERMTKWEEVCRPVTDPASSQTPASP